MLRARRPRLRARLRLTNYIARSLLESGGFRPNYTADCDEPLNFDQLDWSRAASIGIPILVLYSKGHEKIPFEPTKEFAAAHANLTVVGTAAARRRWEANLDTGSFQSALTAWFASPSPTSRS